MTIVMTHNLPYKTMINGCLALLMLVMSAVSAQARIEIDVTRGNVEPLAIAIPSFLGDSDLGQKISSVVEADLRRSGLFAPMDQAAFIERLADSNRRPNFPSWTAIRAQALVVGQVVSEGNGRFRTEFRLWDTYGAEQILGTHMQCMLARTIISFQ